MTFKIAILEGIVTSLFDPLHAHGTGDTRLTTTFPQIVGFAIVFETAISSSTSGTHSVIFDLHSRH